MEINGKLVETLSLCCAAITINFIHIHYKHIKTILTLSKEYYECEATMKSVSSQIL